MVEASTDCCLNVLKYLHGASCRPTKEKNYKWPNKYLLLSLKGTSPSKYCVSLKRCHIVIGHITSKSIGIKNKIGKHLYLTYYLVSETKFLIHVRSKVCMAPFLADFSLQMKGSNADSSPHMEGSHADFLPQMEPRHMFMKNS